MKLNQMLSYCVLGVALVSGCGQKGPLYLPETAPEPQTATDPADGGQPAASGKEEDESQS